MAADLTRDRIVIRRSRETRRFQLIGIVSYLALVVLFIAAILFESNDFYWKLLTVVLLLTFLRGFLILVREYFRKVVLLESHISFNSWNFSPRVYRYEQISNVETIDVDGKKWEFEPVTYVKVTFDDGRILKVQKTLISVREFRKHLRTRTGRTFRKSPKTRKRSGRHL
jgi:hypothetical protein